jgi:hypothetical protein
LKRWDPWIVPTSRPLDMRGVFQVPTLNNSPSMKFSRNSQTDFLISTDAAGSLIGAVGSHTLLQRLLPLCHFLSCLL